MAVAGIVLGIVGVVLTVIVVILVIAAYVHTASNTS
jgi:hypothetical protein